MKLLALVVLFKVEPENSESLQTLANQIDAPSFEVLIWDNSPEPCSLQNKEWLLKIFPKHTYHHCPQNRPLSEVYNEVIDRQIRQEPGAFSHLLLLDQDSVLEPSFLNTAMKATQRFSEIGLFLPLVKANNYIVSPAHMFYFKGSYWRNLRIGIVPAKYKTAINSGMIIASRYLLDRFSRYPENLRLYGTDTWFCQQYARDERFLYVFDSVIRHDLSRFKKENVDVKLWRHREEVRATRLINSNSILLKYSCILFTSLTSIRMAVRFRDKRFLSC